MSNKQKVTWNSPRPTELNHFAMQTLLNIAYAVGASESTDMTISNVRTDADGTLHATFGGMQHTVTVAISDIGAEY